MRIIGNDFDLLRIYAVKWMEGGYNLDFERSDWWEKLKSSTTFKKILVINIEYEVTHKKFIIHYCNKDDASNKEYTYIWHRT